MRSKILAGLIIAIVLSVFLHTYKSEEVPGCLNADEAAFGYNAYSLSRTGADEYGIKFPLRLTSFNDFKLPLYSYLLMPIISVFGLSVESTRVLNTILGVLLVPTMYMLALEIFNKRRVSLISAFLTAVVPWIYILTRHAHEGVLAAILILWSFYFILRFQKQPKLQHLILANIALILSTFSYHTGRIFLVVFVMYQLYLLFRLRMRSLTRNMKLAWIGILAMVILLPFGTDVLYGARRVQNLLFFQRSGFQMRLDEYLREHTNRRVHNKGTEAVKDVTLRYFSQLSPNFLLVHGDTNPRFGYDRLGLITPVEYLMLFVGLYYLFKNRVKHRWLLVLLLAVAPLGNALTWEENSLIRTYFLIFPLILIVSYGAYKYLEDVGKRRWGRFIIYALLGLYVFFLYTNWDVYLNHYFKRALVVRAWQCGYSEMADFVNEKYDETDKFYITKRHGQPYIFLLFFRQFDPEEFQKNARRSKPDEYGYTQVEGFDKFIFEIPSELKEENAYYIGFPEDFPDFESGFDGIKKIKVGLEEIFWIYES